MSPRRVAFLQIRIAKSLMTTSECILKSKAAWEKFLSVRTAKAWKEYCRENDIILLQYQEEKRAERPPLFK